ncbi:Ppx/GppA phosphatase family protein [Flavisolibacter ginsengisoli]|uniref:Exopolyphosphatase / guanosine-5'-triphosphate,3'-diphosphate pyrophosphatase n=1 Tax=Flavisolibacter ginsengisoli DSM 18119 TaxID=1121884 RepID=A0A1M4XGM0_9BACT|nr:exopolyphosphatase [Flavisolibacter ginsengisoli]SHE92483.1 exopolyphosphatase / guanosine-5'-triphosphate,3'-diphosphate pyrophosphatase [Flavisolibacter ginsengisoli DSM 18119]
MRLAAIDIGSNAARLLIIDVVQGQAGKPEFVKLTLVRVPLRLGFDVFEMGSISEEKEIMLVKTIQSYKLLIDVYNVKHFITAATSAMRDASNAKEILQKVKAESGVEIKVITGEEEASFIYENHVAENLNTQESYLYIDVGGGSTELSFFSDGKLVSKESFNIGTIRLLKNKVTEDHWNQMKKFIKEKTTGYHHITAIGSGGNINKIFSLSKRKEGKPLSLELLRNYYKEFSSLSLTQRISMYKLREDRADVIVPALLIYINVMKWADTEEIFVPKIGLADGLVHILYDRLRKTSVNN